MQIITAIFDHLRDKTVTFNWRTFQIEAEEVFDNIGIHPDLVEQMANQLAEHIKEEIDNEILKSLTGKDDMSRLIGICGLIGSGKDTIGEVLVDEYGFTKLSFAGTLKDMTAVLFDWDREMLEGTTPETRAQREVLDPFWTEKLGRDWSPRIALQQIGTEVIRNHLHEDMWLLTVENKIRKLGDVVITDCRFPNEIKFVQQHGEIWQVDRGPKPNWYQYAQAWNTTPGAEKEQPTPTDKFGVHPSEWSWVGVNANITINNGGTLPALKQTVRNLV